MKNLSILFFSFFIFQAVYSQGNAIRLEDERTFSPFNGSDLRIADDFGIAVKQFRPFGINPVLRKKTAVSPGDLLILNLFEDADFRATVISSNVDINRVHGVVAKLEGFEFAYCYVSADEESASVTIDIPELNQKYITRLHPVTRINYLLQLDETRLDYLEGGQSLPVPEKSKIVLEEPVNKPEQGINTGSLSIPKKSIEDRNAFAGCLDIDDPVVIDLLVVYTPAAKDWAISNNGNINTIIADAVNRANLVVSNNHMKITFNLAYSAQVNYNEVNSNTDLGNITSGEGAMSVVHDWRNTYAADFVVLITLTEDTGGLGWLLNNKYGSPDWAFCLSRVQQTGWSFTMIHEIGHNMGAHHHKAQLTQPGPTIWPNWPENTWSAGWRWVGGNGTRYCDIMTYTSGEYFEDGLNHQGVPYFSDPLVKYSNQPTGNPTEGDNARTLKLVKHYASKYRDAETMKFCTASGNNAQYHISNVKFGSIDQDADNESYMDFTHCAADLTPEVGEELRVQIENPYYSNQLLVWIDWNGNNKFSDAGETVYTSAIGSTPEYVINIVAPPGTSPGHKRMRIRLHVTSDGPKATPCGESNHGTVHDYLVNIIDTGCYGVVIQKNPENQATCTNNSSGILSFTYIGTQPVTFVWQYLDGDNWTNVQDGIPSGAIYMNTNSSALQIDNIQAEGIYTYRCKVSNCNGENVIYTTSALLVVNPPGLLPATPLSINGPTVAGKGSTYIYSVKPKVGDTYQWSFPDGWLVLPSQESHKAIVEVGSNKGKVIVTPFNDCGAGIPLEMDVTVIEYCEAKAQFSDYEYIKNVSFNTINHVSGKSKYTDNSQISTAVEIGETYPFSVTLGNGNSADQIIIWIDYNHNGNFTNPGERVYLSPKDNGPFSGTIKIPNHAVPGYARMRVRLHNTSQLPNTTSCDDSGVGEVEDYSIQIKEACAKVQLLSQSEDQSMCTGRDTVVMNVVASGKAPLEYNWQYKKENSWIDINDHTLSGVVFENPDSSTMEISGSIPVGTHLLRCQVTNCQGEKEAVSDSILLTSQDVPPLAEALYGQTAVCAHSQQVYIASGYTDVSYHWQFPSGWVPEGDSDKAEVSVLAGSTGGTIIFRAENECGLSETYSLPVNVSPVPSTPVISFNSTTEILSSNAPMGNQWHDQNGPIPGATGQTHVPGKTATYFTIVTLDGCASDTSNLIHVIPSDVDEIGPDEIWTLFPNPASGYLSIKTDEIDLSGGQFELYNISGQKFEPVFSEYKEYSVVLDLKELPSGQYTIVYKNKNMIRAGKFIRH